MKIYVPADGEMCNVHHDLDCCGRKFNRPDLYMKGIVKGLRMAAEIVQNFHKSGKAIDVDIPVFGINELILAKAKEFEEAKGAK